jgi:hypothetical protein
VTHGSGPQITDVLDVLDLHLLSLPVIIALEFYGRKDLNPTF